MVQKQIERIDTMKRSTDLTVGKLGPKPLRYLPRALSKFNHMTWFCFPWWQTDVCLFVFTLAIHIECTDFQCQGQNCFQFALFPEVLIAPKALLCAELRRHVASGRGGLRPAPLSTNCPHFSTTVLQMCKPETAVVVVLAFPEDLLIFLQ